MSDFMYQHCLFVWITSSDMKVFVIIHVALKTGFISLLIERNVHRYPHATQTKHTHCTPIYFILKDGLDSFLVERDTQLLIQSSIGKHLGCLYSLAIVRKCNELICL